MAAEAAIVGESFAVPDGRTMSSKKFGRKFFRKTIYEYGGLYK